MGKNIIPTFDRDFSSLRETVNALVDAGFKVSQSKISRDKIAGLIKVEPDGSVLEAEARAYASTLERVHGDLGDLKDIQNIKTFKEVEVLKIKIEKQQFELEKERGKYIPRADFEAELAARGVVLESGFRHMFNVKVVEWIALVGGKAEKSADFLQALNTCLDDQLTTFASLGQFQVLFEED